MRLIVGLGNPGEKYVVTRHNAGFSFVDELARQKKLSWEDSRTGLLQYCWFTNSSGKIELIKPQVFMNDSGKSVVRAKSKHGVKTEDIYVVHDDLDIPLGSYKIQFGTGPKVHNGVNSVEAELGTKDFWRVRIGVDNRKPDDRTDGEEYVLQDFTEEERLTLDGVIEKICKEINHLLQ
jgi:PTH1 family peptidyl-tRNA hydrolase